MITVPTGGALAPFARVPVRGRVELPLPADPRGAVATAAAVLTAAAVTGGTVLMRNWDDVPAADGRRLRELLAGAGVYVVRSRVGLTATTRATGGEVEALDITLEQFDPLLPFAAVLALRGRGDSRLRGLDSAAGTDLAERLTAFGAEAHSSAGVLTIRPGVPDPAAAPWAEGADLSSSLAGLVLGLLVRGTVITGTDGIDSAAPGFLRSWYALVEADEYLLPGSDLLPHDYLGPRVESH